MAQSTPESRLSIAAAANLVYVIEALNTAFQAGDPTVRLTVAIGASGSFVAQIRHGAPYDLFLSADLESPQALVASGDAATGDLIIFATGRLVLWTTNPKVRLGSLAEAVRDEAVRKIALANTHTAPYGRAAQQVLEHLGAWTELQPKLVFGENITQTAQFVETGNASAGFVALSLVLSPKLENRGHWIPVPENLHDPIEQGAVVTRRGAANHAAARYLEFLRGDDARAILHRFGYATPPLQDPRADAAPRPR